MSRICGRCTTSMSVRMSPCAWVLLPRLRGPSFGQRGNPSCSAAVVALASLAMARKTNTDFFSSLRSRGLRKRVAQALSDLESRGPEARAGAEKAARRVASDLRNAADTIEKRLDVHTADTPSSATEKAAPTGKRAATKPSPAAKKGPAPRSATGKKGAATRSASATKGAATRPQKTASARKVTTSKSTAGKSAAKRSSKKTS